MGEADIGVWPSERWRYRGEGNREAEIEATEEQRERDRVTRQVETEGWSCQKGIERVRWGNRRDGHTGVGSLCGNGVITCGRNTFSLEP